MTYRSKTVVFYVAVFALFALIVGKQLSTILPAGVASQIGHNSESLCFALLVCAMIQFLRPARLSAAQRWGVSAAIAVGCIAVGWLLVLSDLPSNVATLNEPIIAAGVLALYLQLERPLRWPSAYAAAVLAFIVVLFDTELVLNQAESLVLILLAPIGLDVMDRMVLAGRAYDVPIRRHLWCAALVVFALAMMALAPWAREDLSGALRLGIDYAHRAAEAYWGWLLVHLYFSYWLGRRYSERWVPARRSASRGEVGARHPKPTPGPIAGQ
ncbi:hypothetical protein [Solicola gregarius]|uniref:Uncharacterized protein n=1 Tax=Solicola gregarius TaxID=2908642 RepID=A0AA46TK09_9ACTN|nr:hypothetical protein [Solicola gregarius]UYM06543.1 hypothetical protein L0C25_05575 [Solicola gregarius]